MIEIYNRQTGEYEIEKVAGEGVLKYLYGSKSGKAGLELLIKRKIVSSISGVFCNSRFSARRIPRFITSFNIDMSLCVQEAGEYKSFNEFFIRKLKSEARIFADNPELLLCPGDGRLKAWMNIDVNRLMQVKGSSYTLKELIRDEKLASAYKGGICLLLRLAPVDYHRFHFIDGGTCEESHRIKGSYYSVNPIALETALSVFCKNKRGYSIFHSENFGNILYIEVGATSVGSIIQTYIPRKKILRGDEKGYFKFGGSTILLFLEKGKAVIDEDIQEQTKKGYETKVQAGNKIGYKDNHVVDFDLESTELVQTE